MTNQDALDAMFADMSKQNSSSPDMAGIDPTLLAPVETPPVVVEPVVPVTPVVPNEVTPVVVAPVETPVDVNAVVDAWDVTTPVVPNAAAPVPVVPVQPTFDFSKVAKALDKMEIKSDDELVSIVSELKQKTASYDSLPEKLTKAVEIAQLGGNYLEYLEVTQIDWEKEDPLTLYENHVIDQYTSKKDGTVDYEKVDKLLDTITDEDKELRGLELRRSYINYQVNQKSAIEQQARMQKAQFETSVRNSVNNLQELAGFKLSQSHKDELVNTVLKGEDLKTPSLDRRILNAFIVKNFDKIDSFRKSQIKNSVTKKLLDEVQNAEIRPVGEVVTATPGKNYGLGDYLKELSGPKKF